ncbi:MAG: RagB/SusD family nutrient uptake outer membrane protein [Cyclobacteriaceae bacterium]
MKTINNLKYKIALFCGLILFSQGCIDLEEDVSSVLSLEDLRNEADILAALAPIYRGYNNVVRVPHEEQIMGYGSDEITTWQGGNKAPLRIFDGFNYGDGQSSDINWLDQPWRKNWKVIYYANSLIEGLKTSSASPEAIAVGDGEARFLRALSYLNLVKGYGNVPIILDGHIPTGDEVRATVLENYAHIEEDLLIAEQNLPGPGEVAAPGRASSAAAKTLLAHLYLTWTGWPAKDNSKMQLAANKAKEVIDMNYFELMPIDELWLLSGQNSRESVFSIQFSETENLQSSVPTDNSFHEARGWSDMFPERQFFFDFPENARKEATFLTEIPNRGVKGGVIVDKNPATRPWQQSGRNHPMFGKFTAGENLTVGNRTKGFRAYEVFRYAEVLLIYAEAQARVDGGVASGQALEALNQIRRRAEGLPYNVANAGVDLTTATADEIFVEKGWELAGEFKRWYDLVRLEKVAEANADRDPTEEVPLTIDVSAITWKHYIAPIPAYEITQSKLTQNPEGFSLSGE